jgi:hypothetical protein
MITENLNQQITPWQNITVQRNLRDQNLPWSFEHSEKSRAFTFDPKYIEKLV